MTHLALYGDAPSLGALTRTPFSRERLRGETPYRLALRAQKVNVLANSVPAQYTTLDLCNHGARVIAVGKQVLGPSETRSLIPSLSDPSLAEAPAWLYSYSDTRRGWQLSIATLGEPQSGKLSLGGFRIVPEARARLADFSPQREALGLAYGMEEKVAWSRLVQVGGPLGVQNLARVTGGKCVLLPSQGARVGEPEDVALLDFALECFKDFEQASGVYLTTGQDLGHGRMSNGVPSLEYLSDRFLGCVRADTSRPTGEGNYQLVLGVLDALQIAPRDAVIALIGCGNIGSHLVERLSVDGTRLLILEASEARRKELEERGIEAFAPEQRAEFLRQRFDVVAVNANGGSLDTATVRALCENDRLRLVCGCENLAMPNPDDALLLQEAGKLFVPTELCGMMGYLTAVEEYLSRDAGQPFSPADMYEPARKLAEVGVRVTRAVLGEPSKRSFEAAVREIYGGQAS